MSPTRFPALALVLAVTVGGAIGCAPAPSSSDAEESAPAAAPAAQGLALRLEQAARSVDVGRDAPAATRALQGVLADPASTLEQRDQARLSLSQALEAAGDQEAALTTLEALLAEHPEGPTSPAEETAEARLRKLLTGSEASPQPRPLDTRPVAPFAHALARYFPAPSAGSAGLEVRLLAFGGDAEASDRLGTFAVDRAVREERRQACPLCDDHLAIRGHSSRSGSWVGLPHSRARLAGAVVVYYFDLGDGRIPARYDAELPLPSADIAARLAHGEGLVAARERPGAPPVLLLAAPRATQLAEVEEALSRMTAVPTEPTAVPLSSGLKPEEIQKVVRGSFGRYRACYEAVLARNPAAAGTARMHFAIRGDGSVQGVSTEGGDGLSQEPAFEECMSAATITLVFPANHAATPTKVTYPVVFSPNP